jgi:serine phosphatase RsbU (regulator of sigma subunit)
LRSYALLDLPPEEVLELVDRKMGHFEIGMVATVAVVVTRPPFDSLRIANAGHLPPVLAQPGHDPILLSTDPEPLLGAGLGGSRSSSELAFAPGAVLAMYTDGLVERRDEPIDAGLERLRAIVSADAPPRVTRDIMRTLIGDEAPGDDVALLVVQRTGD